MRTGKRGGYLLLEDGALFKGDWFLGDRPAFGEAVFNTSHSGYQEILTDPSYRRQIMVFTAPHIGNVGVNEEDQESNLVQTAGALFRHLTTEPSSWRSRESLPGWLSRAGIPFLAGADTRQATLHLRTAGAMRAGLFPAEERPAAALEQVRACPGMAGADLASQVTCQEAYAFTSAGLSERWHPSLASGRGLRVAVLDFGVKRGILRELARRGCEVDVLPAATPAAEILAGGYRGVLLSNGPGDPEAVGCGVECAAALLGALPIFGICLGHQLLALAAGMRTFKLPFGHRGANHPVRREADGAVEITCQNHGFAVAGERLPPGWRISHVNLNDGTVEGLAHEELPVFSIQYHPEASPGPREGQCYFETFIRAMRNA